MARRSNPRVFANINVVQYASITEPSQSLHLIASSIGYIVLGTVVNRMRTKRHQQHFIVLYLAACSFHFFMLFSAFAIQPEMAKCFYGAALFCYGEISSAPYIIGTSVLPESLYIRGIVVSQIISTFSFQLCWWFFSQS